MQEGEKETAATC